MTSKSALKAILIDLDGTLADTIPVLYETYRQFMTHRGLNGTPEEFATLMGPTIPQVVDILRSKYHWPETPERLVQDYWHLLSSIYSSHLGLFPGAREFIQHLRNRGIKIGLVTSAAYELADSFLTRHELKDYFDCIIAGEHVTRGKPDPEAYLKALSCLDVKPEEALVVEDSPSGVLSAVTAKIPTIQIRHRNHVKAIAGARALLNWDEIFDYYRETYE